MASRDSRADNQTVGDIPRKIHQRRGPQYRKTQPAPDMDTEGLRIFREETAGLSNRLQMPSIEAMRGGLVQNPVTLMRRFMRSMRAAGLPKERILRVLAHLHRTADSIWPMEQTARAVLQQREMQYEAANDQAEKCLDLDRTPETVRACLDTCNAEIAAQMLVAAGLQRELEDLEDSQ